MEAQGYDENFETICLCAMRYAIGRKTYMPGIVQNFIRNHIKEIEPETIEIMIRDINEADKITNHTLSNGNTISIDGLGDTRIDRPGWEKFRAFLKENKND